MNPNEQVEPKVEAQAETKEEDQAETKEEAQAETKEETEAKAREQRIKDNCKTLFGIETEYYPSIETNDHRTYSIWVRQDLGSKFGKVVYFGGLHDGSEKAWEALDAKIADMAAAKMAT